MKERMISWSNVAETSGHSRTETWPQVVAPWTSQVTWQEQDTCEIDVQLEWVLGERWKMLAGYWSPKMPIDESMSPYMAKGAIADAIKLRILRWGNYPGWFGWAQCNHRVFIRERQRGQPERDLNMITLLALKREERTMSQEIWGACRSWKGEGNGFFPGASEGMQPLTAWVSSSRTHFALLTSRTTR